MSFPDPSVPAPALTPYQLSFRGLAFGGLNPASAYQTVDITGGLDLPAVQAGDVQRPLSGGEFIGVDVPGGRDIALDLLVKTNAVSFDNARQALGAVFQSTGDVEFPLFLALNSGTYACMARPRKFNFPMDINWTVAQAVKVAALLHSTDSRWYASPSKTATVAMPSDYGTSGLTVPAPVPWVLSAGSAGGLLDCWNLGMVPMFPELVITGPCTSASISNLSIAGSPTISFNVSLNAGDTLTIDTDFQTVTYLSAGSSAGAPRDNSEVAGSTWWPLLPANGPDGTGAANVIQFTAAGGTAQTSLTVNWADAYGVV